jgi:hypothetical protein
VAVSALVAAAQIGPRKALEMLRSVGRTGETGRQLRMESEPAITVAQ